ncbi:MULTISPECIES: DUF11 domain-containing protein [unclassified Meiothermus]|uniref:DUF11 domain-containing protein n=1 Tax=unclassified Meiothermus TaxID=370471 RepID=UPI000D7CDC1F|nr:MULTISPECIES: DUF11 domain-containing protein [unclassified Meiothermus]PZA08211.1 hypothetical protein DNA98_03465 [Meiothermus sp. Pnk-1]RYM39403.1 DUF11 domain-containing protein [Meiothermus sp. PNK-Is4]
MRFFSTLLLALAGLAWATPAGTVIRNQAVATVEGQVYLSNPVETLVQAICVPVVSPNGTPASPALRVVASAGGTAYLPYRLRNAGNASFDFSLSWAQAAASTFSPSAVRFYLDANQNAQRDPGEPVVNSLSLAPGQEVWLVLEVVLPSPASGDLFLSPIATCGSAQDSDNYAYIQVGSGPALQLSKAVSPSRISSGEEATFDLVLRNAGNQVAAGPVVLTDRLDTPEMNGLEYVAGSAQAAKGQLEYTADGTTWTASEPASVRGVRLVLPKLEGGEEARLSFRVRAVSATPGVRTNRAEASGEGGPSRGEAALELLGSYAHYLGPYGNPRALPGGEGSLNDQQQAVGLIAGQPYCFTHTLENAGTADDSYTLQASGLPGRATGSFQSLDGSPLPDPLPLAAGTRRDFRYCLRVDAVLAGFTVELSAVSVTTGKANRTQDQVLAVLDPAGLLLGKRVSPTGTVAEGTLLTYTLRIENTLTDLGGVRVVDPLDPALEFASASDGGAFDPATRQVVWELGDLPSGLTRTLTLQARVRPGTPDDTLILNRFSLTSTLTPDPLRSNLVQNRVLSAGLLLQKSVDRSKASYGDRLTYRLEVANPSTADLEVRLVDTPPQGTQYVAGSARLYPAGGGCAGSGEGLEPTGQEGHLVWQGIALRAKERRCLSYQLRVLPGAPQELLNTAQAFGTTGAGTALASARSQARVQLEPGTFAPRGTLVGRVFLDVNRDGRYTPGLDLPLPGARVILGNGWQGLTDAEGRYAFRDLEPGVWTVMLDPASAPFSLLPHPEASGEGYRHRVTVQGLTTSDFPLEAPQGTITAARSTVLEFGPLRIEKRLVPLPRGYRVVLRLEAREALSDLTVTDPLAGGGEKVFHFPRLEGEQVLTYDVDQSALTDPQARWRYP